MNDLQTQLTDFQYDGVDFLYRLEPQQSNLFMLTEFYDPFDMDKNTPVNMKYLIQSFMFTTPDIKTRETFNKPQRETFVESVSRSKDIRIIWLEDVNNIMFRYHTNWLNSWYNRNKDCMVVGQKGKYRNMTIALYHYENKNEKSSAPIVEPELIATLKLNGLIPKNVGGNREFKYGDSASDKTLDVNYTVNTITLTYQNNASQADLLNGFGITKDEGIDKGVPTNGTILEDYERAYYF